MAITTGKSTRVRAKSRSQVLNPATGHYIKKDAETGQFLEVKTDGKPFKGVRKEKSIIKTNPSVKKSTAEKIEKIFMKAAKAKGE